MRFVLIDGDVPVSDKLLKECLQDWVDTYPDLFVTIESRDEWGEAMSCVVDWIDRKGVKYDIMDLESAMTPPPDRVYALIGDKEPSPAVAEVLKSALAVGIEVRDLAEAGVTVVRIDGTVPTPTEGAEVADEDEENYTWLQLGLEADDDESDLQDDAQTMIDAEFTERGLDGEDYEDWTSMGVELGVQDGEEDSINFRNDANNEVPDDLLAAEVAEPEEEPEPEDDAPPQWTAEDLKGVGVRKLKEIAKASNIDPKLPREQIIALLIGDAPTEVEGGETFEDRGPVDPGEGPYDRSTLEGRVKALEEGFAKLRAALS